MTAFTKEQMIPASKLRTLSQRELFQLLEEQGKLGVLFRESLAAVILPHARYVEMKQRIDELEAALRSSSDGQSRKDSFSGISKKTG